jgi:hypothetical protein
MRRLIPPTYGAIADTLNSEGIEPKFHPGYVHRLLTRG